MAAKYYFEVPLLARKDVPLQIINARKWSKRLLPVSFGIAIVALLLFYIGDSDRHDWLPSWAISIIAILIIFPLLLSILHQALKIASYGSENGKILFTDIGIVVKSKSGKKRHFTLTQLSPMGLRFDSGGSGTHRLIIADAKASYWFRFPDNHFFKKFDYMFLLWKRSGVEVPEEVIESLHKYQQRRDPALSTRDDDIADLATDFIDF